MLFRGKNSKENEKNVLIVNKKCSVLLPDYLAYDCLHWNLRNVSEHFNFA